ncbi:MAG: hypothetical protein C5B59_15285 [Bacteroidetes bacterium]|nr:MAG: hypothetical protein C5B59_15285 [Bacteroidota bacterium]
MNPLAYRKPMGIFAVLILLTIFADAQRMEGKKYPALLWEISGNGLKKPSYLFGTMHVSSKMVFHLSDSFYLGIQNADVVALELDPQLWQDELFRYQSMQMNLRSYSQGSPNDYINEKSFQLEKYEDRLKLALSEEPTVINGLLYRTFQPRADFEEDTYLDLYIYQTGRKFGKQATGVENYFETEKLILEATQDMMKDRKRKSGVYDGEFMYQLEKKAQDAYRKGDLDLLDSLEKLMQPSQAYLEKFLYKRNEIQANSVDSILKKKALFVGVGAAHLPGKRGVIELLRKKGYVLRPIGMRDQDARQREDIDKVKVPVNFSSFTAEDSSFSVRVPGKLYKRGDSRASDSWQYADMSNGSYYMITRVKTHSHLLGLREDLTIKKIDSLLYENIPGKILKKIPIQRDGYKGFEIVNRTRRGDVQRYNVIATPFEIFIFKMSGNGSYVEGNEACEFFSSISLKKQPKDSWVDYEPAQGGFKVKLPGTPYVNKNKSNFDGVPRWEYESNDFTNGDAYLVWKKSIQNYRFLEDDSIDLAMMEESFRLSDCIDKEIVRKPGFWKGYPCLDASFATKDGSLIKTKFIIKGSHYYMLAARSRNRNKNFDSFFESFSFTPYRYTTFRSYIDTFVNISVNTPVVPDIDVDVRNTLERSSSDDYLNSVSDFTNFWPKNKTALFQDDSTGEAVYVSVQPYPKYYYPKDSAWFWKEETNENRVREDFIIRKKQFFSRPDSSAGFLYIFGDTNSSRFIYTQVLVKENRLYRIFSLRDSASEESPFFARFCSSFKPLSKKPVQNIFSNKLDIFFRDLFSNDSIASKKAKDAIPNIYFGPSGLKDLTSAIRKISYNNKDYFSTKTKLINELGYIPDSSTIKDVVKVLKSIYTTAGDTSTIQNAVIKALSENKTRESYQLLSELIIQDPPVFNNNSDYNYLFQNLADSLALARLMFPNLLQISTADNYKDNIRSLLALLVDSGYISGNEYKAHFNQILFEARIQLKKQQIKDEGTLQKKNDDGYGSNDNESDRLDDEDFNELQDYAVLLMPFYDSLSVQNFYSKLIRSRDPSIRLNAAILLLRHNKPVQDSILKSLAALDQYRSSLLRRLEDIHRADRFPASFRNQESIARSQLVSSHSTGEFAAIEFIDKKIAQCKGNKGYVYFFKYKVQNDDDWLIGISGLQPLNSTMVNSNSDLVNASGRKLLISQSIPEQFNTQLKKLIFSKYKSAASFYLDKDYYQSRSDDDD